LPFPNATGREDDLLVRVSRWPHNMKLTCEGFRFQTTGVTDGIMSINNVTEVYCGNCIKVNSHQLRR
jgi:hypothetical protein